MNVSKVRPLGDVADFLSGFAWKAKQFSDEPDGMPIIRIQNVGADASTEFKYWPDTYADRFVISKGDLLLTLSGSFRTAVWSGPNALLNQRIVKVTPRNDTDTRWLFYALEEAMARIANMGRHALVSNVALSDLKELGINVPPLDEQKRIAGILDQADALRRLRTRALDKLNTLGQAIFHEMFGDMVRNSKGLQKGRVGDHCHRISVGVVIKPASYYEDDGIPAIRGTNIKPNGIDLSDLVYFSEESNIGPLKKSIIRTGDVLAVRTGRPGLAAVVPKELDGANCIDVLIATTDKRTLLPEYLRDFLNSSDGRNLVLSNSVGQVQQHFNVKSLSGAEIPIPSVSEQKTYVDRIDQLGMHRKTIERHLGKLERSFASLQHHAFRREL